MTISLGARPYTVNGALKQTTDKPSTGELWALALYFAGMIVAADVLNIRLGVELLSVLTAAAALFISRRPGEFMRDWWVLLLGLLLWNLSGPVAAKSTFPQHLDFMLNADRTLFFGYQPASWVQHHLASAGHLSALDLITAVVYNMHLPEPYIVGYFLWRLNRVTFFQFSAAALVLLVLGFITFVLFPAVPPWLAGEPLLHTHGRFVVPYVWRHGHWLPDVRHGRVYLPGVYNGFGPVLHSHPLPFHGTPIFYVFKLTGDAVAAFPSEHAAFPLLECLAVWNLSRRASVWLGLWVVLVLFTILYLGEHWVTDAIAGYAFAGLIWIGVRYISCRSKSA